MLETFISQFLVKIQEYKKIAIFVHTQPDFDAYASAFGLKKWINDNFPEISVSLMIPSNVFKEEEKFLFYQDDPLPDSFQLSSFLGIVLDTPSTERILTQLHIHCKELIIIDHHPKIKGFAELEFIDSTYPAASQILSEMFFYLEESQGYVFSQELAQYFYAGIITDTNNFMSLSVLPSTYVILSKLVSKGLNRNAIHNFIFVRSLNSKKFNVQVLKDARLTSNGLVFSIVTKSTLHKYKMHKFPNIVNMLENISNVEVWSTLNYDFETKKWKCSIRSKELPINQIAKLYGGGGHKTMSATQLRSKSEYFKLLVTLDTYLEKTGYHNVTLKETSKNIAFRFLFFKKLGMYKKL